MTDRARERRTTQIQMRISPSVKEQAKEIANYNGVTLSNYIESLIQKDHAKHKRKQRKENK